MASAAVPLLCQLPPSPSKTGNTLSLGRCQGHPGLRVVTHALNPGPGDHPCSFPIPEEMLLHREQPYQHVPMPSAGTGRQRRCCPSDGRGEHSLYKRAGRAGDKPRA